MTDNRTNEITEEQVEAAWQSLLETATDVTTRADVRAALVAAQGATTEELAKIKPLFENLSREYPNECNKRVKAEAERDSALAAIERVQETLSLHNPNGRLVKEVLAALDGAPEPDDDPCKAETHSWSHYRPEQIDSYWIRCTRLGKHDEHEDSNTGLNWRSRSPVEGESKP